MSLKDFSPPMQVDRSVAPPTLLESSLRVEFNERSKLPLSFMSVSAFLGTLRERFGLSLDRPLVGALIAIKDKLDETPVSEFIDSFPGNLMLADGLVKLPKKDRPIPVRRVVMSELAVTIYSVGSDEDCEAVCGEIYEALCRIVGISTKFGPDVIHARGYASSLIVKMNFGFETVFSDRMKGVFKETIHSSKEQFLKIGFLPMSTTVGDDRRMQIAAKIGSIELTLTRVDLKSGHTEVCDLKIQPRTKSDVDQGEYLVFGEYNNDTMLEFASVLQDKFS